MQENPFFNFKQNTQRTALVAAVVGFMFLAGIALAFSQSAQLLEQTLQLRRQLAANQESFSQLATLQSERTRVQPLLEELHIVFPDEEALFALSGYLQNAATKNKVKENFAFGAEYQGDAQLPKNIGFTMSAQGALADFVSFLRAVEHAPFFVDFGTMEINKGTADYQYNTVGRILLR